MSDIHNNNRNLEMKINEKYSGFEERLDYLQNRIETIDGQLQDSSEEEKGTLTAVMLITCPEKNREMTIGHLHLRRCRLLVPVPTETTDPRTTPTKKIYEAHPFIANVMCLSIHSV